MAAAAPATRSQDRHSRLRPFAWMKRFANRKSTFAGQYRTGNPRNEVVTPARTKKIKCYETEASRTTELHEQVYEASAGRQEERFAGSFDSVAAHTGSPNQAESYRSIAPTIATNPGTILSDGDRQSKAGTSNTAGGGNSIFSSPNHSNRSLTTTLTTIQSQAPSAALGHIHPTHQTSTYFSNEYPNAPVSALPAHLNRHSAHVPTTYRSATANNLLTDNASILTLASSTHRHQRRNSLDTDASIRAIQPTSNWGGSRESLSLSVLSQNYESYSMPLPAPGLHQTTSRGPVQNGVSAPALSSGRNSIYAGKSGGGGGVDGSSFRTQAMDASSVRSGLAGHVRNNSNTGSH